MARSRPDLSVVGPLPVREEDIGELNRVFAEAFTDRYRRDGMVGVRVPELNPKVWLYALRDAGEGAMIWRNDSGQLIAFNIAHHSGVEGWMGPLAVKPDLQGRGVGKAIVLAAAEWLADCGVSTLGLETMPRTVDNIGFYSRLGFVPGHMTITMTSPPVRDTTPGAFTLLSEAPSADQQSLLRACATRLSRTAGGYDFTRELVLTRDLELGDTVVLLDGHGDVTGFALWHSVALADSRVEDEIRVLKLFAESVNSFEALLQALESCARRMGVSRVAVRCQGSFRSAYRVLVSRGYSVRWTDLRMTLQDFPEAVVPDGEILLSNWEI